MSANNIRNNTSPSTSSEYYVRAPIKYLKKIQSHNINQS
jgi:hypothetical protein